MARTLEALALELGRQVGAARDCCVLGWSAGERPVVLAAGGHCEQVLGLAGSRLRGTPVGHLFAGGERAARDLVAACARGATVEQRQLVRARGRQPASHFPAWLYLRSVPGEGVLALVRDLSAQPPDADAALRAADLGRFASLVAHEVRNPLSAVKIALQTLERAGRLQPNDARRAAIAIREVRNIERLLSEVQEFARPPTLALVPIDPRGPVAEVLRELQEEWGPRGVRLGLEAPGPVPLVQADPARLRTALRLLGRQAAQAAEEAGGGTVTIGLRTVAPARKRSPKPAAGRAGRARHWELWVRDPGRTLAAAVRAAAFVPFNPSRARGSGLGLAVVARIAAEHGGEVRFEAAPGGGNVVRLVLPA